MVFLCYHILCCLELPFCVQLDGTHCAVKDQNILVKYYCHATDVIIFQRDIKTEYQLMFDC